MALRIDHEFYAGSIEVLRAPSRGDVELALRPDTAADVRQWFCFDVEDSSMRDRDLVLVGAGAAMFPGGFVDYEAMVSHDGRSWSRASTTYDGTNLCILHQPQGGATRRIGHSNHESAPRVLKRLS